MKKALSHFYLRWAAGILVGSLVINVAGLMILSSRFAKLRKEMTALPVPTSVLAATATDPSALLTELSSIKDELARLRAEQRDINRILELPVSPHEIVNILSNYQTSTGSATKP